jgi:hypothetical protein
MRIALVATSAVLTASLATVASHAAPTVTISSPTTGAVVNRPTLSVSGTVTSTDVLKEMRVTLGTTTQVYPFDKVGPYGFAFALASIPRGTYSLKVEAADVFGATGSSMVTGIRIDEKPVLTVTLPVDHPNARPALLPVPAYVTPVPIAAMCVDDDPAGCASMSASVNGTEVATSTTSLTSVNLAAYAGRTVVLSIQVTDSVGQTAQTTRFVTVSAGDPALPAPIAVLPGPVVDFDGATALYRTTAGTIARLRTISSGAETTVYSGSSRVTRANIVGGSRAALELVDASAWEWSGSTLTRRGATYAVGGRQVLFAETGGTSILVRDLVSSTTVYTEAATTDYHFEAFSGAPNDDFVFSKQYTGTFGAPLRLRAGTTSGGFGTENGGYSRTWTDGVTVAWERASNGDQATSVGTSGGGCSPFGSWNCGPIVLAGGYAAYTLPATDILAPARRVYRRDPSGTKTNISVSYADTMAEAINALGEVMLLADRRYLVKTTGSPIIVSSAKGRSLYVAGNWYLLIDNAIYRVGDPPVSGETGPTDAGSDTAMPDTAMPDTAMPDTAMPDTAMPDTAMPATAMPDSTAPDTTVADSAPLDTSMVDSTMPIIDSGVADIAVDTYVEPIDATGTDTGTAPSAPEEGGGCTSTQRRANGGGAYLLLSLAVLAAKRRRTRSRQSNRPSAR